MVEAAPPAAADPALAQRRSGKPRPCRSDGSRAEFHQPFITAPSISSQLAGEAKAVIASGYLPNGGRISPADFRTRRCRRRLQRRRCTPSGPSPRRCTPDGRNLVVPKGASTRQASNSEAEWRRCPADPCIDACVIGNLICGINNESAHYG